MKLKKKETIVPNKNASKKLTASIRDTETIDRAANTVFNFLLYGIETREEELIDIKNTKEFEFNITQKEDIEELCSFYTSLVDVYNNANNCQKKPDLPETAKSEIIKDKSKNNIKISYNEFLFMAKSSLKIKEKIKRKPNKEKRLNLDQLHRIIIISRKSKDFNKINNIVQLGFNIASIYNNNLEIEDENISDKNKILKNKIESINSKICDKFKKELKDTGFEDPKIEKAIDALKKETKKITQKQINKLYKQNLTISLDTISKNAEKNLSFIFNDIKLHPYLKQEFENITTKLNKYTRQNINEIKILRSKNNKLSRQASYINRCKEKFEQILEDAQYDPRVEINDLDNIDKRKEVKPSKILLSKLAKAGISRN